MSKFQLWYDIVDTIKEASWIVERYNATATRWQKKRYPAHVTDWSASDGYKGYIVWTSR